MTRLLISVEGKSEKTFVENVLVPHLSTIGIYAKVQNMNGNINLDRIGSELNQLIHSYSYVTTLYDFYGFKKKSTDETKQSLEEKIKEKIKENQRQNIIPYIQMYEFEALLFSDSEKMASGLNITKDWIDRILNKFSNNPESINNSIETAPSKIIKKQIKYIKATHAPSILKNIGLTRIRENCSGFNVWLTQLEKLGE